MSEIDPVRLSKTMAFLLRHRPERGNLRLDGEGWVPLDELAAAVSRLLHTQIDCDQVERLVAEAEIRRFEIADRRIRATRQGRRGRGPFVPDILYHAAAPDQVAEALRTGELSSEGGRNLYLSTDEAQAWRVAHRAGGGTRVLYVDASRARRHGARFSRNRRNGLFTAPSIPVRDVLNLQPRFAEQLSAGGIPVCRGPDGIPRLALIRVTRRSGITWEVAKGKLEPGEPPERTAVREVKEEMGVEVDLTILRSIGAVRYGFVAPGGLPRLKTVYLYFLRPDGEMNDFCPSEREGIGAVRWFDPDEALRAVTHTSLLPLMRRVKDMLASGVALDEGDAT